MRLLDNVIDASRFPLPQQAAQAKGSRRIGLGITGLADALLMLGLRYGDEQSLAIATEIMCCICHEAYRASVALAEEKGSFPFFDRDKYLQSAVSFKNCRTIFATASITDGIRNSHLLAIAPTGTISLLAGNVSSGLEPIFAALYTRGVLGRTERRRASPFRLRFGEMARAREMPRGFPMLSSPLPDSADGASGNAGDACNPLSTIRFPRRSMYRKSSPSKTSGKSTTSPMTGPQRLHGLSAQSRARRRAQRRLCRHGSSALLRARTGRRLMQIIAMRPSAMSSSKHEKEGDGDGKRNFSQMAYRSRLPLRSRRGHGRHARTRLCDGPFGRPQSGLPEVGTHKALDPRAVRQIVDDLGLDWNELPGPKSRT